MAGGQIFNLTTYGIVYETDILGKVVILATAFLRTAFSKN